MDIRIAVRATDQKRLLGEGSSRGCGHECCHSGARGEAPPPRGQSRPSSGPAEGIRAGESWAQEVCAAAVLVQGKYRLGRKIGSGSFGDIYIGEGRGGGDSVGPPVARPPCGRAVRLRRVAPACCQYVY